MGAKFFNCNIKYDAVVRGTRTILRRYGYFVLS
jgi:hypothetical protein